MKIIISAFLCTVLILSGCAVQKATLPKSDIRTAKFTIEMGGTFCLGTDGKFWMKGPLVKDDISKGSLGEYGKEPLSLKQREELPTEILPYLSEDNQVTAVYNYTLIHENVVDYQTTLFLTVDGDLYDYRGGASKPITDTVVPDENNLVLVYKNVAQICRTIGRSFITRDGDWIMMSDEEKLRNIAGAEPITGESGQRMTLMAKNVRQTAFSAAHSFAYVDTDANVWVRGYNSFGILANGKYDEVLPLEYEAALQSGSPLAPEGYDNNRFYKVMGDAEQVMADYGNVFVIKKDGSLWGWGANELGNVGAGTHGDDDFSTRNVITKPVKILENVEKIYQTEGRSDARTGEMSYAALTSNGDLYVWGSNKYGLMANGACGLKDGNNYECVDAPRRIFRKVRQFTYRVVVPGCMVLLENGEVYTWGFGADGTLGTGMRTTGYIVQKDMLNPEYSIQKPQKILSDGYLISDQKYMFGVVGKDGSVWSWGYNPFDYEMNHNQADYSRFDDLHYHVSLLIFTKPVKNTQISAVIGADGSVSFEPAPIE